MKQRLALLLGMTLATGFAAAAEQPKLKARLYSSLLGGYKENEALGSTKPMIDLLAKRVQYPIELRVQHGQTPADLQRFGKQVNDGEIHFGVVWGLELGWILKEHRDLKALALPTTSYELRSSSLLLVRDENAVAKVADLKNKVLATFRQSTLMDEIYLDQCLRKAEQNPDGFFKRRKFTTAQEAIFAVRERKADCVMVDGTTFLRLRKNQPGINRSLKQLGTDLDWYPCPAIFGKPQHIETLRKSLWNDLEENLATIHRTKIGKEFVNFWRIERIAKVTPEFNALVAEKSQQYPLELLNQIRRDEEPLLRQAP